MDNETRRLAQLERLIKRIREQPHVAEALFLKWQEFIKAHPEIASFETEEQFYTWATKHPEVDPDVLQEVLEAKRMQDAYFYLRKLHENQQMEKQGEVDPKAIPADIPHVPHLEAAYLQQPRIMEDDRDYQKIEEGQKKQWLEQNPGKDFTSEDWTNYRYGSLKDDKAPRLKKDAEKIFREKYAERAKKYDEEKDKIYKDINDDPVVANLIKTAKEHANARQKYLNAPSDIDQVVKKNLSDEFIRNYPEKADAYTKKGGNIFKTKEDLREEEEDRKKRKKTLPERAKDIYDWYNRSRTPIRVGRTVGRFAGRTGLNVARGGGRLAIQGGRATITGVRAAMQGVMLAGRAGALLVSNPIGWIVIGVIVVIIIIVFLIILLAGGGEDRTLVPGRLYECSPDVNAGIPFDYATSPANCSSGPDVDCTDSDGNTILVVDGNTCAANAAAYYSKKEGIVITANCIDKCTDAVLSKICSPDINNNCPDPNLTCQGSEGTPISGAGNKTFCIEYVVQTPTSTEAPTPFPTNTPPPTPIQATPTPTPTSTPAPLNRAQIIADAQALCINPNPDTRWCVGVVLVNRGLINDPDPTDYVNSLTGTSGWSWDQAYDWWVASGKVIGA